MTSPSPFAGTWQLQSWTSLKNGEPAGYPMGTDAQGQIVYADDGHMCAFLMRADFPGGTDGPTGDTCLSYGGSWNFENGQIKHGVTFSSLPHWIGRELVRSVRQDAGTMTLSTEPEFSKTGNRYEHELIWKKVAVS